MGAKKPGTTVYSRYFSLTSMHVNIPPDQAARCLANIDHYI